MTITIAENFRALFYAPFYLCHALGAYREEGLDVRLAPSSEPGRSVANVLAGRVLLAWGGPMRVMQRHDADPDCDLVSFCEVVTRDPFYLIGRRPNTSFRLQQLCECTLATVSEVPTPWLCLQEDLRRVGIAPEHIDRRGDRTMAENAAALRAGDVDVIQVFEPYVDELLREGAGHVWYAAAARGPTSYTTFITTRSALGRDHDVLLRVTRAVYRTQKWLHQHDAETVARALEHYLPDLSHETVASAVSRYRSNGIWGRDPRLSPEGFVRLKMGLLSGGFIARDIPHERCVDNELAARVIAEDPPAIGGKPDAG